MATAREIKDGCNLVCDGTLTLQRANLDPRGIIVSKEMLMVANFKEFNIHLYRITYGSNVINRYKLEYSHQQDTAISAEAKTTMDREVGKEKQQTEVIYSRNLTISEECQVSLKRRVLPPGKKYHAFFSYSNFDIEWVKKTVETLEKEHGFVCCEYDRDNTPGTPLLKFADDSIKNACKTVVVMTKEAVKSGFVVHEIQMALNLGFSENRNCVVPVLLEDCDVPGYLDVLNYVDAREANSRDIWLPKLLNELNA
ncbi:hypothetical protein ACJMK2_007360 [Sinanodonta woodiana]|uniref:TIR domain-containing protein n=1 Tax=Sinanodonta woodiana TaxID=1069815 RepID=A0ABD3VIB8_SINWO